MSDDKIFYKSGGKEYCDEEAALAVLLQDRVLFCNERDTVFEGGPDGATTVLYVNCNDVFAWACADAEKLLNSEIGNLYKMHKAGPWGRAKWCCKQRNQKPQKPVEDKMRKVGVWDEEMEALPSNTQDAEVQAGFAAIRAGAK